MATFSGPPSAGAMGTVAYMSSERVRGKELDAVPTRCRTQGDVSELPIYTITPWNR